MKPTGRIAILLALFGSLFIGSDLLLLKGKAQTITSPVNNHRYKAIPSISWPNQMPLATVQNTAENDWIFQTFGMFGGTPHALWIGLNDVAEEGVFTWASGEPVLFTNWAPGEPQNTLLGDYVLMLPPGHTDAGKWAVRESNGIFGTPNRAVLEYPPLPWVAPALNWTVRGLGGSSQGNAIALGPNGAVNVAGYCSTNTFGTHQVTSFGGRDGFLCQLDTAGNVRWIRNFGGSANDVSTGMAVDATGNIYVAGTFQGSADFSGTLVSSPSGVSDLFLAKYDNDGTLLWVKNSGSTNITPQRIALDEASNVYVTGYFQGTASFESTQITSAGGIDIFLAKFDSAGDLLWVRQAGGDGHDFAHRIAITSTGESVLTGSYFSTNCIFGSYSLTNAGGRDAFLARYDTDGTVLWVRRDGGTADDWGNGVAINGEGEIYLTGFYKGTAQFDSFSLTNNDGATLWDMFLAKYTPSGELLWAKSEGGRFSDLGNSLVCDSQGNLYLVFTSYGDTVISGNILPKDGNQLPVIGLAKYNSEGDPIWADTYHSITWSDGLALAIDEQGATYFTGMASGGLAVIGRIAPHAPVLRIQRTESEIQIAWPTNFGGFTLEQKSELNPGSWSPVPVAPVAGVADNVVSLSPGDGASFFRLREE